jgi:hypothetical protein
MYADDSTIHISGENISDIQTKVQEDLNRIELWCKDNNMFINCNQHSNNQLKAKCNLNKKVALIQGLNISYFLKEGRFLMIF